MSGEEGKQRGRFNRLTKPGVQTVVPSGIAADKATS